jgi:putative adhesin
MRLSPFLTCLALVAAGPAWSAEAWREQSQASAPAAGLKLLTVENARGRVEVRPSRDPSLHVTALKITRASGRNEARDLARQTLVELGREGTRYVIRVRYPRLHSVHVNIWDGLEDLGAPRVEVRLTIEVPPSLGVELSASSGDLFTEGLTGAQTLRASSGDVSIESAAGPVAVATSSGDVSIVDARESRIGTSSGDVEVRGSPAALGINTSSGDVTIEQASDSLRVTTSSGDITVNHAGRGAALRTTSGEIILKSAAGKLSVASGSGEVQLGLIPPLASANVNTTSGDIRLGIDERLPCTLELRTVSGAIDVDLPVRPQTLTRRLVTASVRGGGAPVMVQSSSGSISVVRGEP